MSAADLDAASIAALLRTAIRSYATHLALDPASITSSGPRSITARTVSGSLLRVDLTTYSATELTR
jgi:hypothetical protein